MVTHYIGNVIAFLHCHYAYLSITITSKLSILTIKYCITVIAVQRSPAASKRLRITINEATTGIVQCRLCENTTLLVIKQLHKITFY